MLVNNTATFGEKFLNKKTLMTKNIIKLEIIVIYRRFFITDKTMIIISS